jgi:hypothetical protein
MANFDQNLSDADERHMERDADMSGPRLQGKMPTVH